jgi:hypothetical protein
VVVAEDRRRRKLPSLLVGGRRAEQVLAGRSCQRFDGMRQAALGERLGLALTRA